MTVFGLAFFSGSDLHRVTCMVVTYGFLMLESIHNTTPGRVFGRLGASLLRLACLVTLPPGKPKTTVNEREHSGADRPTLG